MPTRDDPTSGEARKTRPQPPAPPKPRPERAPKPGGNPSLQAQTRKILGKHYANKYRVGRG